MTIAYKPDGYNAVSPYLIVAGAQRLITLLEKIFGATEARRYDRENGKIMHAEVRLDDSILMISDATEEFPANQQLIHVYVADADATFSKAIAAGCDALMTPAQKEGDPDKRGMFRDFAGNVWAVGTQLRT